MQIDAVSADLVLGYSGAVRAGGLVFVSGQVAWDEDGETVGHGDPQAQAEQAFRNLGRVLQEAGSGLDLVCKLTMLATSREHLPALREVRHRVFSGAGRFPASTFAVISGLAEPDLLVEIEAIAVTRDAQA